MNGVRDTGERPPSDREVRWPGVRRNYRPGDADGARVIRQTRSARDLSLAHRRDRLSSSVHGADVDTQERWEPVDGRGR